MKTRPSGIRIGLVTGQLSQGGAERQVTLLARGLALRNRYKPVVFCLSGHTYPYGAELTKSGISWHSAPNHIRIPLSKLSWLVRQAEIENCGLLYGFLHVGNVYAGAAALRLRLPFIASMRSATGELPVPIKLLTRFFLGRAGAVVANSDSCVAVLRGAFSVSHERVAVIPNLLTLAVLSRKDRLRVRRQWGAGAEPVIGTIALIKSCKRPELFVDVFTVMNDRMPSHFVWVGDGPERRALEKRVGSLTPALRRRFHLEGSRTDIAPYLSAFDVFLLTSQYEGSPNALLEAMAAGKACVAVRVPGVEDVFRGAAAGRPIGVLCDTADADGLARVLSGICRKPAVLRRMGENARRHVRANHSGGRIFREYDRLFTRVLDAHPRKRTAP